MAKGGSRRGARRVHPLTVILIGAFVAAVVFAGYTITKRILDVRAANHAKALASCVSAQSDFAKTYTSYASTVGAAGKADERLRAALQSAVDAANQAMNGGTDVGNDRYLDILVSLQSSYDAVVGALPNDCHFHACVALTFDDGPNKQLTPKLLDALAAAGVQATFFVQGRGATRSCMTCRPTS